MLKGFILLKHCACVECLWYQSKSNANQTFVLKFQGNPYLLLFTVDKNGKEMKPDQDNCSGTSDDAEDIEIGRHHVFLLKFVKSNNNKYNNL